MHIISLRAALVGLVAATLVAVPAAGASAQTQTIKDATGDTWEGHYDEKTDTASYEATGTQPDVDVVKQVLRHADKSVSVTTVYRDLELTSDVLFLMAQVRTDQAQFFVSASRSADGMREVSLMRKSGQVRCDGLALHTSKKQDTLTVTIPRSCLKDPKTVQLRSVAYAVVSDPENPESPEGHHFYEDAIGKDRHGVGPWSTKLRKG